ncbi:hypothetical protein A5724_28100 [Mycobacterium sp. ACS1612]|uniref:hypothetical protein n=1 Tax=Mycobacterium sp. ACS1612 TaxID=1834117 RepID=UPI0007FDE537|nr:hypothetical protein [Mycobacterium sp. ACS1612]OBF28279.1 hypothetical protein A5724_28100 [Mycobacterium sp. ACS1612]
MRRQPINRTAESRRPVLDAAQRLARLAIVSCVILVLAYFGLAAVVVIRTGDVEAVAEVGRAAADLIRALIKYD